MTNPVKGEVRFKDSNDKEYVFKLGTNAQAMIEQKSGLPISKMFAKDRLENMGAAEVRMIFWAGLFRQHKLSEDDVGDLIDDIGAEKVAEIFMEAVKLAAVKDEKEGENTSDPQKAVEEQTGRSS